MFSSYYSQHCDDVCFQQFQFEISTAIEAVKVHILFVKPNFSFKTALPPARVAVDRGTCDQQEGTRRYSGATIESLYNVRVVQ